jgi:hypothetical protein
MDLSVFVEFLQQPAAKIQQIVGELLKSTWGIKF